MTQLKEVPDQLGFYIVPEATNTKDLINTLYSEPSAITREHFLSVNGHLEDKSLPGQIVIVSPADSNMCTQQEA